MTLPSDDGDLVPPGELDARTAALQATVAEVVSRPCATCRAPLCGHGALLAVVLGYRHRPRCPGCLAHELREQPRDLAERALQWIRRRDCFLHVWERASEHEGHAGTERPPCLFGGAAAPAASPLGSGAIAAAPAGAPQTAAPTATYDAGDLGCGDLVLELRLQLRALPPGAVLAVVARDPAAPVDLPAWCGLVGHTLLSADHPHYLIQRKRD